MWPEHHCRWRRWVCWVADVFFCSCVLSCSCCPRCFVVAVKRLFHCCARFKTATLNDDLIVLKLPTWELKAKKKKVPAELEPCSIFISPKRWATFGRTMVQLCCCRSAQTLDSRVYLRSILAGTPGRCQHPTAECDGFPLERRHDERQRASLRPLPRVLSWGCSFFFPFFLQSPRLTYVQTLLPAEPWTPGDTW